jgi:Trypsin
MPIWAFIVLFVSTPSLAMVRSEPAPQLSTHAVMVLGSKGSFCTAIVLRPDIVLTAAHCVTGSSDYRIHWRDQNGQPVLREPKAIAIHPGYLKDAEKKRQRSIDLALIRLAEPLPSRFKSVALSSQSPQNGELFTVAGYGLGQENDPATSGVFRSAQLKIIEPYGPSKILLWLTDPARGAKALGSGACTGDSGGPIFDGNGDVIGVTLYAEGIGSARCGALTQGLLLAPQRAFIDATLKKWGH